MAKKDTKAEDAVPDPGPVAEDRKVIELPGPDGKPIAVEFPFTYTLQQDTKQAGLEITTISSVTADGVRTQLIRSRWAEGHTVTLRVDKMDLNDITMSNLIAYRSDVDIALELRQYLSDIEDFSAALRRDSVQPDAE